MARSAKPARPDKIAPPPRSGGLRAVGRFVTRNPAAVGGSTAFLVALAYVSANALWYQPHAHVGAFFATRDPAIDLARSEPGEPETTIRLERPATPAVPDESTRSAQGMLKELRLYDGVVDGIYGPNTRNAVAAYQDAIGVAGSGAVDDALLEQLGRSLETGGVVSAPPAPVQTAAADTIDEVLAAEGSDPTIADIQRGLKAFGNESIEVDGVIGQRTRSAIREFQSLFGLPETGEPDAVVYAKMKEIGLTN